MRTRITETTLVCIDCKNYGSALTTLQKCMDQCEFDRVLFLTDHHFSVNEKIETIIIPKINSKEEYSLFVMKELYKYIETQYLLICQADGYILNGNLWNDDWKQYSYIGASWPHETDSFDVGNGGFSFRSKELMRIVAEDPNIKAYHPEDAQICRTYRPYLEATYGIKFAPTEVADLFSFECKEPAHPTFGQHGNFWPPFKPYACIKRTGAMGDVIGTEPLMRYFHEKGFNVILDTMPEFLKLFNKHYFPIIPISEMNPDIDFAEINLDMMYEAKPKQNHLKTYFEFCGIQDSELSKPRLHFKITPENKLFKKYVVIHIDNREQPSRNIGGIVWGTVTNTLNSLGYTVIQVGKNEHETINGAIFMNTSSLNMLQYLIAGADMFIGSDSGPSHIAVAHDVPSIIFFGSVNPEYIHPDMSNIYPITTGKVCDIPFCWHEKPGTTGQPCYVNELKPPCVNFDTAHLLAEVIKINSSI